MILWLGVRNIAKDVTQKNKEDESENEITHNTLVLSEDSSRKIEESTEEYLMSDSSGSSVEKESNTGINAVE